MDKFRNDTFKCLELIAAINEKIIQHTMHPQDAAKEIARLIAVFGVEH